MKLIFFLKTILLLTSVISFSYTSAQEIKLSPSFEFLDSSFRLKTQWARETSPTLPLGLGIYSLGFTNSTCTGTLISKTGHVLLARHCLESAISISEQIRKDKNRLNPFLSIDKKGPLDIIRYDSAYLAQALSVPLGLDDRILYARIYSIGPGYLNPRFSNLIDDNATKATHDTLSDEGFSSGGDFAIVQVDELKSQKCFKLNDKGVEIGESVNATRFSCFQAENRSWPVHAQERVILTTQTVGIQNGTYIPKGTIVTDGGGVECNSGSAIRNLKDEIVGVFHSMVPFGATSAETGKYTFKPLFISTQRILELMPEAQRREILELNSACEK